MGFRTLEWRDGNLWLLDQRKLPGRTEEVRVRSAAETARAIREMVVRGAPAIGCAAAYGLALAAREAARAADPEKVFAGAVEELRAARPTAVNLRWALERLSRKRSALLAAGSLMQDGIPVTLLPDAAAGSLIASGKVGCVVVGADRIARNGDTANKVGTYPLALAAHAAGVPFFVAAPISTVDLRSGSGR